MSGLGGTSSSSLADPPNISGGVFSLRVANAGDIGTAVGGKQVSEAMTLQKANMQNDIKGILEDLYPQTAESVFNAQRTTEAILDPKSWIVRRTILEKQIRENALENAENFMKLHQNKGFTRGQLKRTMAAKFVAEYDTNMELLDKMYPMSGGGRAERHVKNVSGDPVQTYEDAAAAGPSKK